MVAWFLWCWPLMTVAAVGVALVCWSVAEHVDEERPHQRHQQHQQQHPYDVDDAEDSDAVDYADDDDDEDRGPLRPSSSPTLLHRAVLTSVRIDSKDDMEKGATSPAVQRSSPSTDDEWVYA